MSTFVIVYVVEFDDDGQAELHVSAAYIERFAVMSARPVDRHEGVVMVALDLDGGRGRFVLSPEQARQMAERLARCASVADTLDEV